MTEKPLLVFPQPSVQGRQKKSPPYIKGPHFPPHSRQIERLTPQFHELQEAFERRRIALQSDPMGTVPEQVLVLETVGAIEQFIGAIKRIPGMERLAEVEEDEIVPDQDFYQADNSDKPLGGRLFLIMANQQAMKELQSLWKRYQSDESAIFNHGLGKWKQVFKQLRTIRPWDIQDRLRETGLEEDWRHRLEENQEIIRFTAELWFRQEKTEQERAVAFIERLLHAEQGCLISQSIIPDIAYHGILAELPISAVKKIIENQHIKLFRADQVMFFRPVGQIAAPIPEDGPLSGFGPMRSEALPQGEPVAALLDGLPLQNHVLLAGRLRIDDPDGWETTYPANGRHHGTAMASLIIHGELDAKEPPITRPLYVRPILKPDSQDWHQPREERIPEEVLPVDLVHRVVRRLFEGESGVPPVFPRVRIINLSVADPWQPFSQFISAWARLLDWLAWKYKVLFIVSAGNHGADIVLEEIDRALLATLDNHQLEAAMLRAIARNARHRRLLAPAEAINVVTVGATHQDVSSVRNPPTCIDPFNHAGLPSPINALGLGYRRSIKPDVLIAGGRQLFREKLGATHAKATLFVHSSSGPPGQAVAATGSNPGDLSARRYTRGTSNAAALITRTAIQLFELIQQLKQEYETPLLSDQYTTVLIKALFIHGARWGETFEVLKAALRTPENSQKFKEYASRLLGYGEVAPDRLFSCTDQRATLLGCGELSDGQAAIFSLPLPPSLSGTTTWRRLTITLAWLSPVNPQDRAYRRAALWFEPPKERLRIKRTEADGHATQRGTLQHEILEGKQAVAFMDGETLKI